MYSLVPSTNILGFKGSFFRIFLAAIIPLIPALSFAQKAPGIYKVHYSKYSDGKKQNDGTILTYGNNIAYLSKQDDKIKQFIDFKINKKISTVSHDDVLYKNSVPFNELPVPEQGNKTEEILGYKCKYATYLYFSNHIEVWYTEEAVAKGSPYSNFLPNDKALVLKVVVNNNNSPLVADSIVHLPNNSPPEYRADKALEVTKAEFEELKINSRFKKIVVFDDEQIHFGEHVLPKADELVSDSTYHFSKGTVILKKIRLTSDLKNKGSVFAKLYCRSNGDAYDRTGSVFIIPASDTLSVLDAFLHGVDKLPVYKDNRGNSYQGIRREKGYQPPIEIMRFFTSFGAGYFNDKRQINNYPWAKDVLYKQDVTSLIPLHEEEIWVGVFIGNYDGGGHKVSLELDFYPGFEKDSAAPSKFVLPLFLTVNTLEMSGQNYGGLFSNDTLRVDFNLPDNVEDLQLLYTPTGHGGWGGGDEFNPRLNQIRIDGQPVFKVVPWRTDCATYRFSNPASGNFGNGLSSSDLSRSNWCPGTLTPPYFIPLDDLTPGKHTIEVIIDQGENTPGGFNHWGVSGILTGELKY